MRGIWYTDRIRSAEEKVLAVTPDGALMRKAAFAASVTVARMLDEHAGSVSGRRVTVLVGAGNNGGDALWAGAFLRRRGVSVVAVLVKPDRAHAEGLAALRRSGGRVVSIADGPQWTEWADVVVDGIVGLSARGSLRADAASLLPYITAPVLAVDLPSGVDPDTGHIAGPAIRAERTVTFGARKPVHALAPGHCGEVTVVDLGLALDEPDMVMPDTADIAAVWPIPGPADDKYTQGVTGVAAGSSTYPGAAVLSASAAVLATSGMVRYAGPAADVVRSRWPEIVATGSVGDAGRVQAWTVGPGSGTGQDGRDVVRHVLGQGVPVCVDADALTVLATHPEVLDARDPSTPLVLTPHDREFARLAGAEPGKDRVRSASALARRMDAVVLLKGHSTIVAAPDGRVSVNVPFGSWLATAGSGDVLSGLLGALLAAGVEPWRAAGAAAHLHSRAASLAADGAPAPASALVRGIPDAIRQVRSLG